MIRRGQHRNIEAALEETAYYRTKDYAQENCKNNSIQET